MDFVKWIKGIVRECVYRTLGPGALDVGNDGEFHDTAEEIANLVEREIDAERQENKVPPIPQEILRKLDDRILYGAHPETITYRVPAMESHFPVDIDRVCSMSAYELERLRDQITTPELEYLRTRLGIRHKELPLPWDTASKPVKVWFNPPYTTVEFSDGSKVTVEQTDFEDSKFSEYAGYCCAVTKKLFGSSTAAFKQFEEAKKKAIEDSPKFKKAQDRKRAKAAKAHFREAQYAIREIQIQSEMDKIRIQEEARKRLEADK